MADYKLTREQFADAFSKGLGRAMMHVKRYGLDGIADILLDACIHNKVYDTQCEENRAKWLFEMFKDSKEYVSFRNVLLKALESEEKGADLYLLCDLVKEIAKSGDTQAKKILKKCVLNFSQSPDKDGLGAEDLVEIYGDSAVLELSRIYGKRLLKNPNEEIPLGFCYDKYRLKLLKEKTRFNREIKAFWDYLVKSGYHYIHKHKKLTSKQIRINKQRRRKEYRKKYLLKKIYRRRSKRSRQISWTLCSFR